ncbi:MAG TPA: sirohydrochlorin chelatase, partial [Cyanobacteria bacterium UBA11148]|nr:sirohydrochlorin chelatase [Cyanobacteria bacterium UBA11148]
VTQSAATGIPHRSDTVLLVVGRGSSDPDANSDVYKMARLLWEGSGYQT